MKIFTRGLLFSLFFFPSLCFPASGKTYQARVIKVFDGDTILARIQGHEEFVRLREIDAPEMGTRKHQGQEPWGRRARELALSRLKDRKVRLETDDREERDAYGRLLAYVLVGDSLFNREMLRSGNAFFYRAPIQGKYSAQLEKAEKEARNKGMGIWDRKKGLKEKPWDFRARNQRDESLFSSLKSSSGKGRNSPSSKEHPVPPDKVVGNQKTMVYHLPGSPYGKRVSPKNRIFFNSAEEAEKAGFRRSRSYSL
ncbi:MAG: thermonuclease family protein [Syntrophaceae bacterium]|nr:thermonuclease family protein [Syntrophaceae bacterium]